MVRFITAFAFALSLFSFTHAVAIDTRECHKYKCPATLRDGTGKLYRQLDDGWGELRCLYDVGSAEGELYYCPYHSDDGSLVQGSASNCPEKADEDC